MVEEPRHPKTQWTCNRSSRTYDDQTSIHFYVSYRTTLSDTTYHDVNLLGNTPSFSRARMDCNETIEISDLVHHHGADHAVPVGLPFAAGEDHDDADN